MKLRDSFSCLTDSKTLEQLVGCLEIEDLQRRSLLALMWPLHQIEEFLRRLRYPAGIEASTGLTDFTIQINQITLRHSVRPVDC